MVLQQDYVYVSIKYLDIYHTSIPTLSHAEWLLMGVLHVAGLLTQVHSRPLGILP
jgi:hypothetical protein